MHTDLGVLVYDFYTPTDKFELHGNGTLVIHKCMQAHVCCQFWTLGFLTKKFLAVRESRLVRWT